MAREPQPIASAPEPAPPVAASPAPTVSPRPAPPPQTAQQRQTRPGRPSFRRRARPGLRQILLAAAFIAGLAAFALARRDPLPAPARIGIGPAWTAVALGPFRAAPFVRLTGDGPFSLRLDGDRVLRVAPGGGTSLRPKTLRTLELRGRGGVTVTLTPRRE